MKTKFTTYFTRFILVFTGLLVITLGAIYWLLQAGLPSANSSYHVTGTTAPITITKNDKGIPYIKAETREDAAFALGFVHAQDRLFQMDMMRRYAAGRLSEIFGKRTLDTDKFMRAHRFETRAKADLENLSEPLKKALQAYTDGVNSYITQRHETLSPEFYALRYAPEPWTPTDCLLWQKTMGITLSHNWKGDLLRGRMSKIMTPEELEQLWPATPADSPVTVEGPVTLANKNDVIPAKAGIQFGKAELTKSNLKATSSLDPSLRWDDICTIASNAWVVDGTHSTTGKPILANDPHLKLSQPGTWYLVRIDLPETALAGVTAPGLPFLVLGHNSSIAWGCTTTMGDVQDIFIEKLKPQDPTHYQTPTGFEAFKEFPEIITIKGQEPETFIVRESRHGIVLTDIIEPAEKDSPDEVYVMAWTGLDPNDETAEAVYSFNFATNWEEFTTALSHFHSPQQNFHYADTSGNIGFYAPARLPIRKSGIGRLPVPGWTGEGDWEGYVPFDGLPHSYNPAKGIIFNANHKVVPDNHPFYITRDYDNPPLRAKRLDRLLSSKDKFDLNDMQAFQQDITTLLYEDWRPFIDDITTTNARANELKNKLLAWDGIMDKTKAEPLIFEAWTKYLHELAFYDRIGPFYDKFMTWRPEAVRQVLAGGGKSCAGNARCTDIVTNALVRTDELLSTNYGTDMKSWAWGNAHKAKFVHSLFTHFPIINRWSDKIIATSGHRYTLNEGGTYILPLKDFTHMNGPGYRAIYDMGNLENSLFMITPGQSGHFLSPHYNHLVDDWAAGKYMTLPKEPVGTSCVIVLRK